MEHMRVALSVLVNAVVDNIWWFIAALAGRMMYHSREVQAGRRAFWGRELATELPIAFGMGLVGFSVCAFFDLHGPITSGLISSIGYLGPRAIDALFSRLVVALPAICRKTES